LVSLFSNSSISLVNRDVQCVRVERIVIELDDERELWFLTVEQRGQWTSLEAGEWA